MHRFSTLVLGLIFFGSGSIEQGLAGKLRASCVKVDITPGKPVLMQAYPRPGPSEGVLDRIYHRVVALDDGETQVFLISSDLALSPLRRLPRVLPKAGEGDWDPAGTGLVEYDPNSFRPSGRPRT